METYCLVLINFKKTTTSKVMFAIHIGSLSNNVTAT